MRHTHPWHALRIGWPEPGVQHEKAGIVFGDETESYNALELNLQSVR